MNHFACSFVLVGALVGLGCDNSVPSPLLAPGQRNVTALVGDGEHVYWTTADGFVRRVSAAGGVVEEVATGVVSPTRIALDTDSVYWAENGGQIRRAAKAGGTPELLLDNEDGLGGLQVDDGHLYWLRPAAQGPHAGQVRRAPKIVGAVAEAITQDALDPSSLALQGTALFYPGLGTSAAGDSAGVRQVASTGGAPFQGFAGVFHTLATHGATLCAAGPDPDALSADPGSTLQAVTCGALDGSGVHLVASGLTSFVGALAVDDTAVYFGTADGSVSAVAIDGSGGVVPSGSTGLVTSSDGTLNPTPSSPVSPVFVTGPSGGVALAVDATSIYWAHASGDGIYALPRF